MENRNNNQNNKNLQDLNNQENYNEQNNYQGYHNYDNVDNSQYNNFENLQGMNNEQVAAPQKNNYGKLFLTVFAAFALGATSVFGAQAVMGTGKALNSSVTTTKEDKDNQQITVNAISKAKDAVVSIVNYQSNSNNNLESILGGNSRRSGSDSSDSSNSSELKPASSGSGVIYKKSGNTAYVVTNNHVVNGAKKLSVILSDGTNVNAEVVGTDVWTDLAVLKISGDNVTTTMDFADSEKQLLLSDLLLMLTYLILLQKG